MLNPKELERFRSVMKQEDERLPIVFNALSDPKRCTIFRSFLKRERLCVSDIARVMNISMSSASQHLKVLEITGLLVREREGRVIYFKPNTTDHLVQSIINAIQ